MSDTKPKPGSAEFDVDSASDADLTTHLSILEKRAKIKALAGAETPAIVKGAADDVHAVHTDGSTRTFSKISWEAMETQGKRDGWEVAVAKPADLK